MSAARRLFRFGNPAWLSQPLRPKRWNPVLALAASGCSLLRCGVKLRVEHSERKPVKRIMKQIGILWLACLAAFFATAADSTNLTVTIAGKPVQFDLPANTPIVKAALELLASCAYLDAQPKWNTPPAPRSMDQALPQPHVQLVFSRAVNIEVPIEKVTVAAKEIVISLPLATAGIWVRSDAGIRYFAKFTPRAAANLQKALDQAHSP